MSDSNDQTSDTVLVVLSILITIAAFYLLWTFGVIRDWVGAVIGVGAVIVYLLVATFGYESIDEPLEPRGGPIRQARHTIARALAVNVLRPGYLIGRAILRLFSGGGQK